MDSISGYLMNANTPVAKIENDIVVPLNVEQMPYFFLLGNPTVIDWLLTRASDHSRVNSRLLRRALKIARTDDVEASAYVNGACITDRYWVKVEGSNLSYDDVRFTDNAFAMLSLHGDTNIFQYNIKRLNTHTPDLTSIGSYEKCWIYRDGFWYLQKRGTKEQIYSEMMAYLLGKRLGFSMAEYRVVDENTIETKDFTDNAFVNFEPMQSLIGEEKFDLQDDARVLGSYCSGAVKDFVNIQYLDAVIRNPDRHEFNYGLLRDCGTGTAISLAPNFDNNLALIANAPIVRVDRHGDDMIEDFCAFIKAIDARVWLPEQLSLDEIKAISDSIAVQPVTAENVSKFIFNGMQQIRQIIEQ